MSLNIVKKIRIENEEHSKKVQDALFDEGFSWSASGIRDYKHTHCPSLCAEVGNHGRKYILYNTHLKEFDAMSGEEYVLVGDKLVKVVKVTDADYEAAMPEIRSSKEVEDEHRDIDMERMMELNTYLLASIDLGVKVPSSVHLEYTQLLTKLLSYK